MLNRLMAGFINFTPESQEMNFSKTTSYAISVLSFMAMHEVWEETRDSI